MRDGDKGIAEGSTPANGLRRRQLLSRAAGAMLGVIFASRPVGRAIGGAAPDDGVATARETSYWRRVGDAYCHAGRRYEDWCYYTCYGSTCEVAYCETRDAGAC